MMRPIWINNIAIAGIVVGLIGCSSAKADEAEERNIHLLVNKFLIETNAAMYAPRINISGHISNLGQIKYELISLQVSESCIALKQEILDDVDGTIEKFGDFASGDDVDPNLIELLYINDLKRSITRTCQEASDFLVFRKEQEARELAEIAEKKRLKEEAVAEKKRLKAEAAAEKQRKKEEKKRLKEENKRLKEENKQRTDG